MNKILWTIVFYFLPLLSIAAKNQVSAGKIAQSLLEPVNLMADMLSTASFVIGGAFLFASLIKYVEHKRSPLMVPISTVIYLFLFGLSLALLPFVSLLTENGIRYSLFK